MVFDFKKRKHAQALNWDLNMGAFRHLKNLRDGANLLSFLLPEIYLKTVFFWQKEVSVYLGVNT